MKYGDFFNGKKVILFNIDNTIRESKLRKKYVLDLEDIQLRMHARRRLVKLKHLGYAVVGFTAQEYINKKYAYTDQILKNGFFLTQKSLGPGKFDRYHICSDCEKDRFSDKILEELGQYNPDDILFITENGRDWNLAAQLGFDSQWSTRFFKTLDDIRII